MELQGTTTTTYVKNFSFNIKYCLDKPNCKTKEEIDEWIKDVQIDSWVIQ